MPGHTRSEHEWLHRAKAEVTTKGVDLSFWGAH